MNTSTLAAIAVTAGAIAAAALVPVLLAGPANARGAKEFFQETYNFKQPMHGYEGRAGNYYCSYTRLPVHKMVNGRMVIVGWQLEQRCQ
jgi:hypothetical protein